jgi:hypothetical protein
MALLALISMSILGIASGAFGGAHMPEDISYLRAVRPDRLPLTPDSRVRERASTAHVLAQAATPSASPGVERLDAGTHKPWEGNVRQGSTPDRNTSPALTNPPSGHVHIGGAGEEGTNLWVPNGECLTAVQDALERHSSVGTADQTCAAIIQKALAYQREHPERPAGPTPEFRETPAPPPSGVSSSGP